MELITIKELGELTPSKANIEVVSKQLADTVKKAMQTRLNLLSD